jgi:SAM-dependent methyltransferase
MDSHQSLQEEEYEFPYHYLPTVKRGQVCLYPHWSWGYRYLGGIDVALGQLRSLTFSSLLDVGCGDGRLLREISNEFRNVRATGIDYSDRAIGLASALNPRMDYRAANIREASLAKFDVVTLIEVLEHIHPEQCDEFLAGLAEKMHEDSHLLLTVPHVNEPVNEKHYRHFNSALLCEQLADRFEMEELFYFDRKSRLLSAWQRLMCNKYFIVRHQATTNAFYDYYRRKCLMSEEESCLRMGGLFRLKC